MRTVMDSIQKLFLSLNISPPLPHHTISALCVLRFPVFISWDMIVFNFFAGSYKAVV